MSAIAAEWLAPHPLHAAIGLVPAAVGEDKLADAARDHLHTIGTLSLTGDCNGGVYCQPIVMPIRKTLTRVRMARLIVPESGKARQKIAGMPEVGRRQGEAHVSTHDSSSSRDSRNCSVSSGVG